MNEMEQLKQQVARLTHIVEMLVKSDRINLSKNIYLADGVKIHIPSGEGTLFGTGSASKIGFYGAVPVDQWSGNGGNAGHYNTGAGAPVRYDDKFSGSGPSGSQYFINDIVQALKDIGILAS